MFRSCRRALIAVIRRASQSCQLPRSRPRDRSTAARGRGRGRTSSTRPRPPRRSSPTPGCGRRRRSWSPARARTAAASTSTRTSSTTTTAAQRGARPGRSAQHRRHLLEAERHLHLPDRLAPTRTTPPTSSSCASGRWRARPRSASRSTRSRTPRWPPSRSRSAARRAPPQPFPAGANVSAPADLFLTVHPARHRHGRRARRRATGGTVAGPAPTVDGRHDPPPDRGARPALRLGPDRKGRAPRGRRRPVGQGQQPLPAPAADRRRHPPRRQSARPSTRPPSSTSPSASASRCPQVGDLAGTAQSPAWWRDKDQGDALARRRHQRLPRRRRLPQARREHQRRRAGVPQSGPMDRILASHFETAQGADFSADLLRRRQQHLPGRVPGPASSPTRSTSRASRCRRSGYGMTLLLHSLGADVQPVPRAAATSRSSASAARARS